MTDSNQDAKLLIGTKTRKINFKEIWSFVDL